MGRTKMLYLGPYFECEIKSNDTVQSVWGCSEQHCERHPVAIQENAPGNFCYQCGAPNRNVQVSVSKEPDRWKVVGDALLDVPPNQRRKRVVWMLPNEKRSGCPRKMFFDDLEDHECLDMANVDRNAEMSWLENAYAGEQRELEEVYASVCVRWGLHRFWL